MKHTIFPLLLLLGAFACKKPVLEPNAKAEFTALVQSSAPLVGKTVLEDTLPVQTIEALGIGSVSGVKLQYAGLRYASYYAYQADADELIATLSRLPFDRYAVVADTTCYKTSFRVLEQIRQTLSPVEEQHSAFFWNASEHEFEVYECLKAPLRHTVLISRATGQVLHRVEHIG